MTSPCSWCGTEISDEYHPEDSTRCHELDGTKHDQLRCQTVMKEELSAARYILESDRSSLVWLIGQLTQIAAAAGLQANVTTADVVREVTSLREQITKLHLELISALGQAQEWVPRELYDHARFMAAGWRRLVKVRDGQLEDAYEDYDDYADPNDR